jgi:hypothetical protein
MGGPGVCSPAGGGGRRASPSEGPGHGPPPQPRAPPRRRARTSCHCDGIPGSGQADPAGLDFVSHGRRRV